MSVEISRLVNWVIGSLDSEPDAWSFDEFNASHSSGIKVWIANSSYGLRIEKAGVGSFGGVTPVSPFFGWLGWRGRVYRAARKAQIARLLKAREVRS